MDVSVSVLPVSETGCREKASSFVETVIEAHSLIASHLVRHIHTEIQRLLFPCSSVWVQECYQ